MKNFKKFLLLFCFIFIFCIPSLTGKTRVIVQTDIGGGEPDDYQSLIRFLLYANDFNVRGLIATTSMWQHARTYPELIIEVVNNYGKVYDNLKVHCTDYPTKDYLLNLVKNTHWNLLFGSLNNDSAGSEHIIDEVFSSSEPTWVVNWGGAIPLAQAVWKVKNYYTPVEYQTFVSRLRVFDLMGQCNGGAWIAKNHPDIKFIRSVKSWRGISPHKEGYYQYSRGGDESYISQNWIDNNINNHGSYGGSYPEAAYITEGDTPTYLYLIPNGLSSPDNPHFGSWGGRYSKNKIYITPTIFEPNPDKKDERVYEPFYMHSDVTDDWLPGYPDYYAGPNSPYNDNNYSTVFRWRRAFQNDFAARIDWTITSSYQDANHPPIPNVNSVLQRSVNSGDSISLSAQGSSDPDGDSLSYHWFMYKEAGTYNGTLQIQNESTINASFIAPNVTQSVQIHIILIVRDSGSPPLDRYKRLIITVNPTPTPDNLEVNILNSMSGADQVGNIKEYSYDNIETTRWGNDGVLGNAWIEYSFEPALVNKVSLKLYKGDSRTYPVKISAGSTVVFDSSTETSAGFWSVTFPQVSTDILKIEMVGANSDGGYWLSIYETDIYKITATPTPTPTPVVTPAPPTSTPLSVTPTPDNLEVNILSSMSGADQTGNIKEYSYDNIETTRWCNDGTLANAWIEYIFDTSLVNKISLKLYKGDTRTYPVKISAGSTIIFDSSTVISTEYWETTFSPISTSALKIEMTGANSDGGYWLSIYEIDIFKAAAAPDIIVTASKYQDPNVPENTIDGDLSTRWSAEGDGEWIMYELEEAKLISDISIAWYKGDVRKSFFDVEISTDGVYFTKIYEGVSSGTTKTLELFNTPDFYGKYIKIIGHGNTANMWSSINEVEINYSDATQDITVTASADDGNIAANTLDNDFSTRWSASGDGQWIEYDLGALANVSSMDIAWYKGDQRKSFFEIQLSSDGIIYTQVYDGISSGDTLSLENYNIDDTYARYVRIIGHGNTLNTWNSITEVEINTSTGTLTAVSGINTLIIEKKKDNKYIGLQKAVYNLDTDKEILFRLNAGELSGIKGGLNIYDIKGNLVYKSNILNKNAFVWNMSNIKNKKIKAGLYIYELSILSDSYSIKKKGTIIIIK